MAARFERQDRFDVNADRLLALLVDPDFQRDRALALGALQARCRSRQEHSTNIVTLELIETTSTTWGRHESTMTIRWDKRQRESTWHRVINGLEQRSRAEGWSRIVEEGQGCRLLRGGEVEVRVPVVGRMIERKVVDGINEAFDKEVALYRQRLATNDWPTAR